MKNLIAAFLLLVALQTEAQIRVENPKTTAERSVEGRVNSRIDQGINRGLDKVEEGVSNIFKKKDKSQKDEKKKSGNNRRGSAEDEVESEADENPNSERQSGGNRGGNTPKNQANTPANDQPKSLKSYSKFDFVAGEKVLAVEDFSQDAVGDFPAKWNTNASGEVVKIDGNDSKWLQFGNRGIFFPEFVKELPENFTVEFDMMANDQMSVNMSGLLVAFPTVAQRKLTYDPNFSTDTQVGVDIHPVASDKGSTSSVWVFDKSNEKIVENTLPIAWKQNQVNRISIWRQKTRFRLYINETKVWDLPRAFDPTLKYSMLLATNLFEGTVFASNLRVAVGAPDTRSKLITEGKFSTTGILFDVNSDKIKPESYGVLKEIGTVLKENATVKVRIIGHTDADGDDAKNLDLSKRRAASVKNALQSEFGIEAARMETDGKGETQPAAPNTTPEGKANNRRVEFVKL
ncbi:MAG: OmpA family protein [Spirosomaceae bacterium]|nr:OmpA family protein [Spirosomataceae bacterium]